VSHWGLANYIKKYLKEKKNYGNSNISPCKKYNLQKNPLKETQNPSRYYIILELISSFNTSPIIIFQKSYYNKPII
jgi:hypothetical protein